MVYADGYMARTYNMMSEFGDIYDHARDIIFLILNVIYPNKKLVSLFVIGVALSLNSFACQEIIYEANCKQAQIIIQLDGLNHSVQIIKC
jgi:phosphatidylglycerophosphate synthase